MYLFYGFEACGDVAEEVKSPGEKIPRAMRMTIYVGGAGALFLTFSLLMGVKDFEAVFSGENDTPITTMFVDIFGPVGFRVILFIVLISFLSCALSLQAAASRLIYSSARDGMFPGSRIFSKFSAERHIPPYALLLAAIIPAIVVVASTISPNALEIIISFGALGIYITFMMVTLAALRAKLKGWKPSGDFNMGRWSILINFFAIIYQFVAALEMIWPRSPEEVWYINYLVLLSTSIVIGAGFIFMFLSKLHKGSDMPEGDIIRITDMYNKFHKEQSDRPRSTDRPEPT